MIFSKIGRPYPACRLPCHLRLVQPGSCAAVPVPTLAPQAGRMPGNKSQAETVRSRKPDSRCHHPCENSPGRARAPGQRTDRGRLSFPGKNRLKPVFWLKRQVGIPIRVTGVNFYGSPGIDQFYARAFRIPGLGGSQTGCVERTLVFKSQQLVPRSVDAIPRGPVRDQHQRTPGPSPGCGPPVKKRSGINPLVCPTSTLTICIWVWLKACPSSGVRARANLQTRFARFGIAVDERHTTGKGVGFRYTYFIGDFQSIHWEEAEFEEIWVTPTDNRRCNELDTSATVLLPSVKRGKMRSERARSPKVVRSERAGGFPEPRSNSQIWSLT